MGCDAVAMKRNFGLVQIRQIPGDIDLRLHIGGWQPQIQRIWGWLRCFWNFAIPKRHKASPRDCRLRLPPGEIDAAKAVVGKAVLDATGQSLPVTYSSNNKSVTAFMARKDAAKLLSTPALNPDELVYANGSAMWLEKYDAKTITRKLKSLVSRGQKPAAAFVVKGLGLFVAADEKTAPLITDITTTSLTIRMYAAKFGGVLTLNKRQQDFINNWESEAFRKKLVSKKK